MTRWLPCSAATLATFLFAGAALADRVAVLPARGGTDDAARQTAQAEITRGLTALGHEVVADTEVTASLWAVLDGVPDSTDEYRTVGTATSAGWVLLGLIEPAVKTTRVELLAFHGSTGRVESVAREVEQEQMGPQIQEMLSVLVRPEGIGEGELPWERAVTPPAPSPAPPTAPPAVPPAAPGPSTPTSPPPGEASAAGGSDKLATMHYLSAVRRVWPPYSGGKPFGLSALIGFSHATTRPEGAIGSASAALVSLRASYAFAGTFEPFVQFGSNLSGPGAVWVEGGARYLFTPGLHMGPKGLEGMALHFGLEATAGAFIRPGQSDLEGPSDVRYERSLQAGFTMSAAGTVIVGISPGLQLEAQVGNLRFVPLSEGSLVFVGATAGVGLRY
ncbi:hypothetical protein [Chondromyces apiculatus]|uniref:Uncharacterized protein n=1 Tax=Chondromyces apiculatus DSM 436 TaxID=1192034 RepID=A0A017T492_9BACT|nr:hypothetical protein [Chondromyces apiculatus]EYF03625.1 Hypothetical protein CAP_5416 [Chondromyces apiculatus DSM 436]